MPKIKHIAISTQDVDATARFYIDVFGLKEVGKVDSPGARGYYLSDGDLNLAILQFHDHWITGIGWVGLAQKPRLPSNTTSSKPRPAPAI